MTYYQVKKNVYTHQETRGHMASEKNHLSMIFNLLYHILSKIDHPL